ncbi:hypothetical protein Tco_0532660 [Tanacetum coccineum]
MIFRIPASIICLDMARRPCPWEIEMPDPSDPLTVFTLRMLSERADALHSFPPNLLNTLPSFRGLGLGEGGLFCLSLLKTLAIDDGLRECLFPCLLLGSTLAVDVLDSEQCDSS